MFYSTCDVITVLAEKCAHGSYQLACARGLQRASGSDLGGAARSWNAKYRKSRESWLDRLEDCGVFILERRVGQKLFVILATSMEDAENINDEQLLEIWC